MNTELDNWVTALISLKTTHRKTENVTGQWKDVKAKMRKIIQLYTYALQEKYDNNTSAHAIPCNIIDSLSHHSETTR